MKKLAVFLLALVLAASFPSCSVAVFAQNNKASADAVTVSDTGTQPKTEITVPLGSFSADKDSDISYPVEYGGKNNALKWASQSGKVQFKVNVPKEDDYSLRITYMPIVSKNRGIRLSLMIDGVSPFKNAGEVEFHSIYGVGERKTDSNGNDMVPRSVKLEEWVTAYFTDPEGLSDNPMTVKLGAGEHTISFESDMASIYIADISLVKVEEPVSYEDYLKNLKSKGAKETENQEIIMQGEDAVYRSDPSLIPKTDRSSAGTVPCSPSSDKLNIISSSKVGQWLSWEFEVKQSGFYQIGVRFRQNSLRGFSVTRRIYIDGEVPFKEFSTIKFSYENNWQYTDLGEPYLVYLEKGKHELRMDVVLGEFSEVLKDLTEVVQEMNALYRKIIMITSTSPDSYRDYQLEKQIEGFSEILADMAERITEGGKRVDEISGEKEGGESVFLYEIADQLNSISQMPETMASRLDRYNSNVTSLSSWIYEKQTQGMDIDYWRVSSVDTETPLADARFFGRLWYRLRSIFYSFIRDYSSIGDVYEDGKEAEPLEVWMSGGSDQAKILKNTVDDLFISKTGIPVNLRLVQVSIITATFAGNGPDISLNIDPVTVINMAARKELVAVSDYEDFAEATKNIYPESLVPFKHEGKYYGIPVTHSISMMFYRTDIFEEMGLTPPNTWQEFNEVVALLQANNMQAGIGNLFTTLLLQQGIDVYNENLTATNFDKPEAIDAFTTAVEFFTHTNLPDVFDFYNRFRSGEMPIGIVDIGQYNMLSAAAPEIRGLWKMVPIPGTPKEDGTIVRTQGGGGSSAAVMFKRSLKNPNSWEFIKWWTGAEAQARYGNDIEMALGTASRYAAANKEAVKSLPWSNSELENIFAQWDEVKEIPTLPASYYLTRGLNNAFRNVVYNDANPREEMFYQNKQINKEIVRKRKELNLD